VKYSWKLKLECVSKYKNGEYIETPGKSKSQRKAFLSYVRIWAKDYEDLGIEGLKHSPTNKDWTPEERFALVAKVLAGCSIQSVAQSAHVSGSQLHQWVRRYDERGMGGLQCKKGRPPMKEKKAKKTKLSVTEREELRLLRERNEYLEMENEYLKKLDALVSAREAAEAKAKKRK
jgi:transposase